MRGPWILMLLGVVTIPLWLMGCPGTLDPHEGADDDDAADDDAADDDAADDDAADDDAADDDAADDDAADDDASDDDASDDDVSDDDDDSQPPPPGVEFDVIGGPLAGYHLLDVHVECGWDGPWAIYGAGTQNWTEWIGLYIDQEPGAGDHFAQNFGMYGEIDIVDFEVYSGGANCFLDVVSANPLWGTFECADVDAWDYNNQFSMDLVNGRFRCP